MFSTVNQRKTLFILSPFAKVELLLLHLLNCFFFPFSSSKAQISKAIVIQRQIQKEKHNTTANSVHKMAKIIGSKSVSEKRSEVIINYSSEHTGIAQDENWTSDDLKLSTNPINTFKTKYICYLLKEVTTLLMAFLPFKSESHLYYLRCVKMHM